MVSNSQPVNASIHWTTAINLAKLAEDVTFEEWCDLYVNKQDPTAEQIAKASQTAKEILVRLGSISADTMIILHDSSVDV